MILYDADMRRMARYAVERERYYCAYDMATARRTVRHNIRR